MATCLVCSPYTTCFHALCILPLYSRTSINFLSYSCWGTQGRLPSPVLSLFARSTLFLALLFIHCRSGTSFLQFWRSQLSKSGPCQTHSHPNSSLPASTIDSEDKIFTDQYMPSNRWSDLIQLAFQSRWKIKCCIFSSRSCCLLRFWSFDQFWNLRKSTRNFATSYCIYWGCRSEKECLYIEHLHIYVSKMNEQFFGSSHCTKDQGTIRRSDRETLHYKSSYYN